MMAAAALVTTPPSNRSMSGSGDFRGFSSVLTVQTWLSNEKARRSKPRENAGRRKSVPVQRRSSPGSDTSTRSTCSDPDHERSHSLLHLTRTSTPTRTDSPRANDLIDPFGTSLSSSKKTDFLLKFFSTAHMARYYWSESLIADHNNHIVSLALSEPVLFNALMAKTLTDIRCGRGFLLHDFAPEDIEDDGTQLVANDLSFYKMRTMQCLQESLNAQTQERLQAAAMLAIILTIKDEVMNGTVAGIEVHLGAFRKLIRSGVSMDWLSPAARSPSLFTINAACAVAKLVPPLVPPPCTDSVLPEKIAYVLNEHKNDALAGLCQGFSEPGVSGVLGHEIVCYISWQRNFVLYKELTIRGHLPTLVEDFATAASMMHRADYHLLSVPFLHGLTPLQETIRVSLLIADVAVIICLPAKTFLVRSLASQLKKAMQLALPSLPEPSDPSVIAMLLWSCFLGAYASARLKERPWFLMQLIKEKNALGLSTQDHVAGVLSSFLYTEKLFKNVLLSMWEEIEELSEDLKLV